MQMAMFYLIIRPMGLIGDWNYEDNQIWVANVPLLATQIYFF
jgi:hypothetical protein